MYFQPGPVAVEPRPNISVLVIGCVVLNQDRPLPAIPPRQLFPKAEVGGGIEDRVLAVIETRLPQFNGSEDFHGLSLSGDRDFRRAAYAAPGGVERRVLPEAGFISKDERPVSRVGFFLSVG